jgi:hypothetical protein
MSDDIFTEVTPADDPLFWPQTVARALNIEEGLPRLAPSWVGCSLAWLQWAASRTGTVKQLVIALLVLRQCRLHRSRTVSLPNTELRRFGITRYAKYRALKQLEQARLIRIDEAPFGKAMAVTLLDHPPVRSIPAHLCGSLIREERKRRGKEEREVEIWRREGPTKGRGSGRGDEVAANRSMEDEVAARRSSQTRRRCGT